jgi:hypothetical protein
MVCRCAEAPIALERGEVKILCRAVWNELKHLSFPKIPSARPVNCFREDALSVAKAGC